MMASLVPHPADEGHSPSSTPPFLPSLRRPDVNPSPTTRTALGTSHDGQGDSPQAEADPSALSRVAREQDTPGSTDMPNVSSPNPLPRRHHPARQCSHSAMLTTPRFSKSSAHSCRKNPSPYACPRCNIPYCSLECYQSPSKHSQCSEPFFKEEIHNEIGTQKNRTQEEKNKMWELLRKFEDGVGQEGILDLDKEGLGDDNDDDHDEDDPDLQQLQDALEGIDIGEEHLSSLAVSRKGSSDGWTPALALG